MSPDPSATFSCTSCSAVLSVPANPPGSVIEGPCPYCGAHQRFAFPMTPAAPSFQAPAQSPRQPERPAAPPLQFSVPPVQASAPAPAPAPAPAQTQAPAPPPAPAPTPPRRHQNPFNAPPPDRSWDSDDSTPNPVASALAGSMPAYASRAPHRNPKDYHRATSTGGAFRRALDMVAMIAILGLLGAIGWVGWEKFEPEIRDFVAQTGLILPSADPAAAEIASDASKR